MRIPFTGPLPLPTIYPPGAATTLGAAAALAQFLSTIPGVRSRENEAAHPGATVLLTGAGVSVASGLADYRGEKGTYTQNRSYRPVYFHEFIDSHEARKRYWARSFLGWSSLQRAKPNPAHFAIGELARKKLIGGVVTQNVDSFHSVAHPDIPTVELHGYLRALVCISCGQLMARDQFQLALAKLNPAWAKFLQELLRSGALDTENPAERRQKGYRTNPDGDADVPGAPYTTFRYPACPKCYEHPSTLNNGSQGGVVVDQDGAWSPPSTAGILKPNVVMFGESISTEIRIAAEMAIDRASKILVVGSSLATYSAWRLAKRAHDQHMPMAILNLGGVRKEEVFLVPDYVKGGATTFVRASQPAESVLPEILRYL